MEVTALAPWFGSNRMLAAHVGDKLAACNWVGVPFGGGLSELLHIKASTIVVSDLHRHIINLARTVQSDELRRELITWLEWTGFHPDVLAEAQHRCREYENDRKVGPLEGLNPSWAFSYFVSQWCGRSGEAGTDAEFKGNLPVRWTASGGDSAKRFRSATESLEEWGQIFRRCNFLCLDVFEFLDKVKDLPKHGLYLDPPFPDAGDVYTHKFTEDLQRALALRLLAFKNVRIVCRFYDHPLIREIYPEKIWTYVPLVGRKSSNAEAAELLLVRN